MSTLSLFLLKTLRWSGWLLLPLVLGFLFTGYVMDGRFGLGRILTESTALTLHRMFHVPLVLLVLAHTTAAVYLSAQRWGWPRRP
jgi:hypothetical protein